MTFQSHFTEEQIKSFHQIGILIEGDSISILEPLKNYKILDTANFKEVLQFELAKTDRRHYGFWSKFASIFYKFPTYQASQGDGIYRLRMGLKSGEKWGIDITNIIVFKVQKLLTELNNHL